MKTLIELEHNECRYPTGEGAAITFECGAHVHSYLFRGNYRKSSYCREHHFICTVYTSEKAVA